MRRQRSTWAWNLGSIPSDETTPFLDQTRGRLRDPDAHPGTSFNGRLTKIDPPGVHTINRSEAPPLAEEVDERVLRGNEVPIAIESQTYAR